MLPQPSKHPLACGSHESGVWQEYSYDTLGRRVMAAASFEAPCENGCRSYTDWVVWSGDQMIGELRGEFGSDAYGGGNWEGRIAYTHGPGIDAPLSLVRHGIESIAKTIVPHANWRGTYGAGTYANGSTAGVLDLTTVRWPADDLGAYLAPTEPYAEDQPWIGALIGNIRDANGWLYRRNRYYDPATGRFTQEDPIGIAGGLNLYAYGGGDAVSYADPYGLYIIVTGTKAYVERVLANLTYWSERSETFREIYNLLAGSNRVNVHIRADRPVCGNLSMNGACFAPSERRTASLRVPENTLDSDNDSAVHELLHAAGYLSREAETKVRLECGHPMSRNKEGCVADYLRIIREEVAESETKDTGKVRK